MDEKIWNPTLVEASLLPLWVTYWDLFYHIIILEIVAKLLRTGYHVYLNTRSIAALDKLSAKN